MSKNGQFVPLNGGVDRRTILGGALALTFASPVVSPIAAPTRAAHPAASNNLVARLGDFLADLEQGGDLAGTILLARGGEPIFHRAYGIANRAFDVRNRGDTRFNLASIGKIFTAVAIMRLVESGRIALNDRLIQHLPSYPNTAVAQAITIEQLLSHRSGIGNFSEGHDRAGSVPLDRLSDYLPLFANDAPMFAPGAQFGYSNAGYVVLGLVIEAVTGEEYFDHIRRTIFAPLGMAGTDFLMLDISAPNVATGYTRAVEFPGKWQSNILQMGRRGDASGGSYSTAIDMLRFAQALQNNRLLSAETTRIMTMGRYPYGKGLYGYGVSEEMANGHRIYGHSGGHYGIADELMIFEDLGLTAIILTNCDVDAYFAIANWLKHELVGETASTRAYWQSRVVIERTIVGGIAAGRAAAAAQTEGLREIVIALAGQKALHRGENATGIALLSLNRELFPQSSEAVLNLATAFRVLGDNARARAAYTAYLAMEPDDSDAAHMLTRVE